MSNAHSLLDRDVASHPQRLMFTLISHRGPRAVDYLRFESQPRPDDWAES